MTGKEDDLDETYSESESSLIMIGKDGEELDPAKIDQICQVRKLQHQQEIRDRINLKLARMSNSNPLSGEEERSYGVEREGQAYDIWYLILRKVTDPSDIRELWNVSEASGVRSFKECWIMLKKLLFAFHKIKIIR